MPQVESTASPTGAPATVARGLTARQLLFSFEGRIGRGEFVGGMILAFIVAMVGFAVLGGMGALFDKTMPRSSAASGKFPGNAMEYVFMACMIGVMLVWLWAKLAVAVKRCHDLDVTGAVLLLSLIPFVGILVFLWLLFGPGTQGSNRWGDRGVASSSTPDPTRDLSAALRNRPLPPTTG